MADRVRFTETLRGTLAPTAGGPAEDALFTLVVVTADVDAMVVDPSHRSSVYGVVLAGGLHPAPLRVTAGHLDLFIDAAPDRRIVHMKYEMWLEAPDGARFFLSGTKVVSRRRFFPTFAWDGTTLAVEAWRGDRGEGPPAWRGVLRQGVHEVLAQGATFRGDGGWLGLRGIVNFMRYYLATVLHVYLGPRAPTPALTGEVAGASGDVSATERR